MDLLEKATIMHYHRHRMTAFQPGTAQALGWRNEDSQQRRYRVLAQVGDLTGASILDAGCGYGDLKAFLDTQFSRFDYIGIDQMPEFIAEAKSRFSCAERTAFYQTDFSTAELPQVDYVLACGVLGYRCQDSDFYRRMIEKLYAGAKVAFAFNMLDKEKFPEHELLLGHDQQAIVAFCQTLSPKVVCINDYLEDDFAVFMYRGEVV